MTNPILCCVFSVTNHLRSMMGFSRASVAQGISRPRREVGESDLRAKRLVAASAHFDNPIGCHALCWTGGWDSADACMAIQGSKAAGFSFVEVPLLDPETVDAQMTRGLLEEHEMSATSSLGLTFDADISSEDAEVVERGKQLLFRALEKTQGMGGTVMCGVIFSALGKYPGPATVQGRANCVRSLKELAVRAQDAGVVLGLEYVNRYETNVLNTAAQTMEMIADIGMDNVKVHLDTYHANIEEVSIASAIRACGPALGYVHIGESHRGYLGTGSIDWKAVFHALADCDYKGPIAFESFSSRIVSPTLSNTLCVWRDLWEDSTDLAQQSHSFITAHLNSAHRLA